METAAFPAPTAGGAKPHCAVPPLFWPSFARRRMHRLFCGLLGACLVPGAVSAPTDAPRENATEATSTPIGQHETIDKSGTQAELITATDYAGLRKKITYGQAQLAEVYAALTEKDVAGLTNTMHALYSMRWHRGVYHLYQDLWHLRKNKHPQFAWETIATVPARLALASTINRAQIFNAHEFKDYLRAHKYDEHEFHRAQVIIALGLNGDPDDVDYLAEMAAMDNVYLSQSAITSLALMAHSKAQKAMEKLWIKHQGTPRGDLLLELLDKGYRVRPALGPASATK